MAIRPGTADRRRALFDEAVEIIEREYPDELEPATKPIGASGRFGAGVRPMWQRGPSLISPQLLYPWAQTEQALHDLAKVDASPFDDVAFEYTNPTTGSHVLPTIGC